ncbi:type II secretion system minor pseudopilin GspI [Sulfitobacter sabulilitoris]|uniref:Type II secretion system protein I n=1 Tax=Sulfitobacter sabulilitoris TaxID=2562655 RepID=A0A5S3PDE9_9RHOB|nr:type II secretion system minor pseudopilin GspI [Sulfitobacter sabulilitoris]TMM51798.1 type II secretion system protein GspI [Sulfitobacter sabulilitoris]
MTAHAPRPACDAGFTLIEALVAMSVLAIGGITLLIASEGHARRIGDLTDRTAARWVAQDALTGVSLGLDAAAAAQVPMMGAMWRVRLDRDATPDPLLTQITARVGRAPDAPTDTLVTMTRFVADPRKGP